ncbi:hypothetical protein RQP50_27600 [Paenibacillus sp. chi10]|uniref:Uncharacterized protein n=1 Tax=Paenibacillus suaedae TaxID=3077233 RepID=A0AAJ2K3Q0_9BACL|nr:hypothetical protein [Paenibacillus sp. chi10]MDT8980000.1 hypothetical protein [Paenibacillus sp. chi10]
MQFFNNIDANAWIQTFGGFIGALLAGGISIFVFRGQVKFDLKKEQNKEIEKFLKSNLKICNWLKSAAGSASEISSAVNNTDLTLKLKIAILRNEINALSYCIDVLNQINDDYIPLEYYKDFIEMKAHLDLLNTTANIQLNIYESNNKFVYTTDLDLMAAKIAEYNELFAKYGNEKEARLHLLWR